MNNRKTHNKGYGPLVLMVLVCGITFARAASPDTQPNLPPRLRDADKRPGMIQSHDKDPQSTNSSIGGMATNEASAVANTPSPINGLGEFIVLAREKKPHSSTGSSPQPQPVMMADASPPPSPLPPVIILIVILVGGMGLLFRKMETE